MLYEKLHSGWNNDWGGVLILVLLENALWVMEILKEKEILNGS